MPTTARDQAPYLEQEDKRADGTQLLAIHNITQADVDLIKAALSMKRTNNIALLSDEFGLSSTTTTRLRAELERIDTINLLMHLRA